MTQIETMKVHPTEVELSDLLAGALSDKEAERLQDHIASCETCLEIVISAHESVKEFKKGALMRKGKAGIMKKINIYLIFAILSFGLSFITPRFFIQLLVATLLLGIKWIVDSKSTKMLVMIYEAWKKGGEKEASRILKTLDSESKNRF